MARKKKRNELTDTRILDAAMKLADRDGIDSLTIRKLAAELEAGVMSVYYYFDSKESIINAMVEEVFAEIKLPETEDDWRKFITERSFSMRKVLRQHPWAPPLMDSRSLPGPNTLRHHNEVIGCLRRGGLSLKLTSRAVAIIDSFIYGFALQENSLPGSGGQEMVELSRELSAGPLQNYPYMLELAGYVTGEEYRFDEAFGHGLELILSGLELEASQNLL